MKRVLLVFVVLVLGISIGAVVAPAFLQTQAPASALVPTPTSIVRSGPTVFQAIQTQSKLSTIVMTIAQDATITRVHGLGGVCTEEITYLGYFSVSAGIDLAKITRDNILVEQDGKPDLATVTVQLPAPEILSSELDTTSSRLVAQQTPKWIPGCSHQVADMTIEAQQKIRESIVGLAQEKGILQSAQEKAGFEIERILLNAGYKNVTIRYAKA